jgi:GH18 family chitinase
MNAKPKRNFVAMNETSEEQKRAMFNIFVEQFIKKNGLESVDIDAEYKLIGEKKSKLSSAQRRSVIMVHNFRKNGKK